MVSVKTRKKEERMKKELVLLFLLFQAYYCSTKNIYLKFREAWPETQRQGPQSDVTQREESVTLFWDRLKKREGLKRGRERKRKLPALTFLFLESKTNFRKAKA